MKRFSRTSKSQREIAERLRKERAFIASERRYRSLFENMTEGYAYCRMIYEGDLAVDYIYEQVNNAFEPLTGLKNVIGRRASEVVPGIHQTNPEQIAMYARVAWSGHTESYEAHVAQMGIWFSISAYSQEKGFFVVIFGNITARKVTEEALRESQRFAESIAHNSTATIYIYDLETRKNLYTNRNAAEFLGYSSQEIIEMGENILPSIIHPDDMERVNRHFAEFTNLPDGDVLEIEYRIRHASGAWHWNWGRHTIFKRRPNGAAWQMMGTAQDVTRRKLAEEALRERAQLAELEADTREVWTHDATLASTLQLCCEALVRHLDAAFARIWTLNEPEQMLEMQASAGLYTHLNGPHGRVPVGQFKIGLIAEERKPHLTNQVVGDSRVGDQDWAIREGMVAFAGYPLIVGDRLVGVIALFARHVLSETTLIALASVAENIAISIERQRWETKLRESDEKFHHLADNVTDVFWIASPDLARLHYLSPAFERIWGRPVQTLYENLLLWTEFIVPEDREMAIHAFTSLTTDTTSFDVEYRIMRPDGEIRWVRALGFQVWDASGSLIRLTGIVSDITKRKLAEEELHLKTVFLAAQVNSTLDAILVVDARGKKMLQNQRLAEIFKIPAAIAEEEDDAAQVQWVTGKAKNPDLFIEKVVYLYAHPDEISRDEIELTDGTVLDRYSAPVIGQDGKYYGRIWTFHDITERRRAVEELEKTHRQLLEASRLSGMAEIATNVLHNVGNVLNSVNVSTDLIIEGVRKSGAASLARVVALLQEHPDDLGDFITTDPQGRHVPIHLAHLSEHLLSRQAAMVGELGLLRKNVEHIKEIVAMQQNYATFGGVRENIDLVALVEDSLRMNEASMSRHEVEIVREFEAVPLMNVEKHKILQILVNLLRNAKHACDDSSRTDKRLTVRVTHREERVQISVIDNGVGIPPENLDRIFNHGFTTRASGHGFGLHSGALAAKDMGGSLTVHSDGLGHGATFTFELPCQDVPLSTL